jgi:SAM-dependent methyltransferase
VRAESGSFKDHFSGHAQSYAAYRPTYPEELFRFLADCCSRTRHAWDCATGNGQTAIALVPYFERLTATDASATQIDAARPHPRIGYRVAQAEESGLPARSVDLVTVSQALHWFDIDRFLAEALRVLAPGGVLAAWSYALCSVDPAADSLILDFYKSIDEYWPPERRIVEEGYRGIEFPMAAIPAPDFEMAADWSADAMLGYLRTWSASQRFLKDRGVDPVDAIEEPLRAAWGYGERRVRWPLALKLGRA